jgi:outer membrane protein
MKNINYIISAVLAVAIAVLFFLHFKGNQKPANNSAAAVAGGSSSNLIAYVNIDSLETNYIFFKEKRSELEKRQKSIETILQKDAETLQREVYDLQQRASSLTQSEGEAIQERLMRKQYDLENKKNELAESFLSEQTKFNNELNMKLDSFLTEYNSDKKFAYILSYTKGGFILYKDEALDITKEVVDGMNEKLKK